MRECDAVFSNLRGDQPDEARPPLRRPRARQPAIVCCSLSGFGMTGPRGGEGAYDYTLQGLAGWQSVTGDPAGPPTKSGLSLVDFCGGYVAALAILAGVWRARRDGRGGDVDLSLFETALAQLTYLGTWVASRGYEPVRRANSAHQSIVPFQNFETADGWIVIACPKQALWERLCRALGRAGAARRTSAFATLRAPRPQPRRAARGARAGLPRRARRPSGSRRSRRAGVPCAPVNDVAAALADPQVAARDGVVEYRPPGPRHRPRGRRARCASTASRPRAERGPFRGEHTVAVLRDLCGYAERPDRASSRATASSATPLEDEAADDGEWRGRFLEDFAVGDVYRSRLGRTRHRDGQHVVHAAHDEHEPDALQRAVRRAHRVRAAARRLDAHARDRARPLGRRHERERRREPRLGRDQAAEAGLRRRHALGRVGGADACASRARGRVAASSRSARAGSTSAARS